MTGLVIALATILMSCLTLNADTIGDPAIPRPTFDGGTGQLIIYNGAFSSSGETVTNWSFYSDSNASNNCSTGQAAYVCYPGASITPVLLEQTSPGNYTIAGIGTTRANNLSGLQTNAFGLVSGSDAVGPTKTFGFKSGGALDTGDHNFGVVDFSDSAVPEFIVVGERTQMVVGNSYSGSYTNRSYSVNFTAESAPEPTTQILLALGFFGAGCFRFTRAKGIGSGWS